VLATISDKKIGVSLAQDSSLIDHYEADVQTAQDYYPFGMIMPGRMLTTLSIPGGTYSGTTQVNGYTLPTELTLTSRAGNQATSYVASDLIDLNEGFESGLNDDVTAYIADGSYAGGGNGSNDAGIAGGGKYRYGFNGKEKDDEVKGVGNQIDYGMRVYDPRAGRFMSVDPITQKYPQLTPYQFASNTPIWASDLDGLEANFSNAKMAKEEYIPGIPKVLQFETFKNNVAASTYNTIVQDVQDVVNVATNSKGRHEVIAKYGSAILKVAQFSSAPIDQQYASLKRYFSDINNVEDLLGGIAAGSIEGFGASLFTRGTAALVAKGVSSLALYEGNSIIQNALKSGGRLVVVEGDELRLMKVMGKQAGIRWLGNGVADIQIPKDASRAMIIEEAIHYQQYVKYGEDYMSSKIGQLKSEVEAQETLLRIGKKEKWSAEEMNEIKGAKATWEKALKKEQAKH